MVISEPRRFMFLRQSSANDPISNLLVYGGISYLWTLTLQTTFKYIILTLQADNKGEGGIFSLFALVRRFGKKAYFPAIIGAATLLADGIITPPISVASAVEGLNGVHGLENLIVSGNNLTVGIVIAIISLLFFFQRFGTKIVGSSFGPIMLVWFSMILVLGLIPIIHNPAILTALSPHYGIELLTPVPKRILVIGCGISLYYRCRSTLQRSWTLWQKEYSSYLDIRKDCIGHKLYGTGCLDPHTTFGEIERTQSIL